VLVQWITEIESNILGFNILRQEAGGEWEVINSDLITSQYAGQNMGAQYGFIDKNAEHGRNYAYKLQVILLDGSDTIYGPREIEVPSYYIYTPAILDR